MLGTLAKFTLLYVVLFLIVHPVIALVLALVCLGMLSKAEDL